MLSAAEHQCRGFFYKNFTQELLVADKEGKDVNLNKTKTRLSSKYGLETSPKLVDIIAAVPSQYKKVLVPKLRAKPVRTASGIAVVAVMCKPHRSVEAH